MKAFGYFRRFIGIGITLGFLFSTRLAHAQGTGPIGPPVPAFSATITSPTDGEVFPANSDIQIKATATDYDGAYIDHIAIYAGTNLLIGLTIDPLVGPPGTNGSTVTLPYNWTNVPAGTYTLTAVAGDTKGVNVTSPPVNIAVGPISNPPHLPIVTIIATDPIAVEPGTNHIVYPVAATAFTNYVSGTNTATFLVRRIDPLANPLIYSTSNSNLTVYYSISGTASNGVDYVTLPGSVTIPAGKNYALITVVPLEDKDPSNAPPFSTVILTLMLPPTASPAAPPYKIGWPNKAGAIILEECLYPGGPPIGLIGPPIAGGPISVPPYHVTYPAANGTVYCVQVSTNLIDWLPVCTNAVVKNSIQFLDPETGTCTNRFYRVVPAALPVY